MQALYGGFEIKNLSEAEDTRLLEEALDKPSETIDIGHAGTTMRFLLAYYAATGQAKILTGSPRMKERPIGPLVNALRQAGAEIGYLEKEGYPPVKVQPVKAKGGKVEISGNISSQFISALLMVGPTLQNGLELIVSGEKVSETYIAMTLGLMKELGLSHQIETPTKSRTVYHLLLAPNHQPKTIIHQSVEPDWSAASYWYAFVALADVAEITLLGLKLPSLQGDAAIAEMMKGLGVESSFSEKGVHLSKTDFKKMDLGFDFTPCPDLAQTIIVLCAALDIDARFTGLQTLRIKETDRIAALQTELKKFGKDLAEEDDGWFTLKGKFQASHQVVKTYNDHRMAMAFAPLVMVCGSIEIENPDVVKKSYPKFWEEVQKLLGGHLD